MLPQKEN